MLSRDRIILNLMLKITLVEVVWSDDDISNNYITRLNKYLNYNNLKHVTTAMFNKEILPGIDKTNLYNRFMLVFDYDENKDYQRCFSYSSPKPTDNNKDLRYFRLPNKQKIMLNSSIDIPNEYLIKVNFDQMIRSEINPEVKKNLMDNVANLRYAKKFENDILEQYNVIQDNIKDNHKFNKQNVQRAHNMMIDGKKQFMFCDLELLKIAYVKLYNQNVIKNDESIKEKIIQLKHKINEHPVRKELKK
jgi:hypothetical protein